MVGVVDPANAKSDNWESEKPVLENKSQVWRSAASLSTRSSADR